LAAGKQLIVSDCHAPTSRSHLNFTVHGPDA
jgi:hypothetical protein